MSNNDSDKEKIELTDKDIEQLTARHSAEFWYKDIWKSVDKCVFCDLKEKYIIKEVNGIVLTTNIYPYVDGHLMIVPRRHITHIKEFTAEEWETVRMLHYVAKKMLRKLFDVRGLWMLYREGDSFETSEKTVEHLHVQLIPYVEGLVEWNYQKVYYPPRIVAKAFKDNENVIEKFMERFEGKYGES